MKTIFHFVSTNVLSGLENVVINICTLVKGYKFVYVSPNGPINTWLDKYHIEHISVDKISPMNVNKVIRRYNPDIVQGHDVKASLSLACNYGLCHKRNIKIFSELHNDDPRMWHYTLRSILYALSTPFYNKIIVISKAVIHHYIFRKLIKKKTIIINNIVNINRISFKQNHIKKWDCIFLGRLVNQKNPLKFVNVIKAISKYNKNIKAIMVGNGPLNRQIQCYIHKNKLDKNIKMLGFKNDPFKYLSESKILLMPSKYEGFGLVALEALLVGTPVICSYTGGLIDIVNSFCGGFANHINDYCIKTINLLNNQKMYNKTSVCALRHGEELNDMQQFIRLYKSIYER